MSLFDCGDEAFKGAIHGATLILAIEECTYNMIVARSQRGQRWHVFSAVAYAALVLLELNQIARHMRGAG